MRDAPLCIQVRGCGVSLWTFLTRALRRCRRAITHQSKSMVRYPLPSRSRVSFQRVIHKLTLYCFITIYAVRPIRVVSSMAHVHVILIVHRLPNCLASWQSRGEEDPSSPQSPDQHPAVDNVEERQTLAAAEDGCDGCVGQPAQ